MSNLLSQTPKYTCYCKNIPFVWHKQLNDEFECKVSIDEHVDIIIVCLEKWTNEIEEFSSLLTKHPQIPVVVVLNQACESDLAKVLLAGAADCFKINSDPQFVILKLKKLISSSRVEIELRNKQTQVDEVFARIQQEENFARHVYEEITGGVLNRKKDYFSIQHSADGFCGDFLFEMVSPTGIRYVFLADAMGHGLAAAISIMPVIHVVKAMAHRSMPITSILQEVNRRLNVELPDDRFVTLAALEISPFSQLVSIVNAGLPDLFVMTKDSRVELCPSHCIPLGIAEGASFSFEPYTFKLDELSRLFMYTDGLIEQENQAGESIGKTGLLDALINLYETDKSWDEIAGLFDSHKGHTTLSDDVTLCAIDFSQFGLADPSTNAKQDVRNGKITVTLDVNGDYLKSVDVPAFVSKFLYTSGIEGKVAGKTFTAVAELYQNGLDHGVLELNSDLKNDIEGFEE